MARARYHHLTVSTSFLRSQLRMGTKLDYLEIFRELFSGGFGENR